MSIHNGGHYECWVVVDGSFDDEWIVDADSDPGGIAMIEQELEIKAATDNLPTDLYILSHNHPVGDGCECAQYTVDHKPFRSWNTDG